MVVAVVDDVCLHLRTERRDHQYHHAVNTVLTVGVIDEGTEVVAPVDRFGVVLVLLLSV